MSYEEAEKIMQGEVYANYYEESLRESEQFRERYKKLKTVVKSHEMPWENSPHGKIKHVINEKMGTKECGLDIYILFIPPNSKSGKHRHMMEEVFYVLEGEGYDLHWDLKFDCKDAYIWEWESEPKRFEWEEGDFVYIPPYTTHQHFNSDPEKPARIISATNRLVKKLGFNWIEQIENAPEYEK